MIGQSEVDENLMEYSLVRHPECNGTRKMMPEKKEIPVVLGDYNGNGKETWERKIA